MKNIWVGILAFVWSLGVYALGNEAERVDRCRTQLAKLVRSEEAFSKNLKDYWSQFEANLPKARREPFPELSFSLFGAASVAANMPGSFNLLYFLEDENLPAYFCGGEFVVVNPKLVLESALNLVQRKRDFLLRAAALPAWAPLQEIIKNRANEIDRLSQFIR